MTSNDLDRALPFLQNAHLQSDLAQLTADFSGVVRPFGIVQFGVIRFKRKKDRHEPLVICGAGIRPEWTQRYIEKNYLRVDPCYTLSLSRTTPFLWGEIDLTNAKRETLELFDDIRSIGMGNGEIVPWHGPAGPIGCIALQCAKIDPDPANGPILRMAATVYAETARELHERVQPPQPADGVLTKRELQCLQWWGRGKPFTEIACILDVAPATVRYYFERVRQKLDVITLQQALVIAFENHWLEVKPVN